jgi:hypothetical protein
MVEKQTDQQNFQAVAEEHSIHTTELVTVVALAQVD